MPAARARKKWGDPLTKARAQETEWLPVTPPAPSIFDIDFASVDKVQPSAGGSGGVVFARCKTGTFVIKGCSTVAQEALAGCVAHVLGLGAGDGAGPAGGVVVPRFRVLAWPGKEWSTLQAQVKKLLAAMPPERAAPLQKVKKGLDRPQLLVFAC
eukprot:SAG22_NODE_9952_length_561_cov_1.779221_1_plen_154_part_01